MVEQKRVGKIICPFEHETLRETNGEHKNTCHTILDDVSECMNFKWKQEIKLHTLQCQGKNSLGEQYLSSKCLMGENPTFPESVKHSDIHYCKRCRLEKSFKSKPTLWCKYCYMVLNGMLLPSRRRTKRKTVY